MRHALLAALLCLSAACAKVQAAAPRVACAAQKFCDTIAPAAEANCSESDRTAETD